MAGAHGSGLKDRTPVCGNSQAEGSQLRASGSLWNSGSSSHQSSEHLLVTHAAPNRQKPLRLRRQGHEGSLTLRPQKTSITEPVTQGLTCVHAHKPAHWHMRHLLCGVTQKLAANRLLEN